MYYWFLKLEFYEDFFLILFFIVEGYLDYNDLCFIK